MAAAIPALVGPLLTFLGPLIERFFPDKEKQQEFAQALQLASMQAEGQQFETQAKLALGQLEVDKAEASSGNFLAASWRPAIGWVCAAAMGFHYIINPLMIWGCVITHAQINPPDIQLDSSLWQLMFGMLGLGAFRTYEKVKGAA